jgi:hypothetical protein
MQQAELCLIEIRDTLADLINHLDADPPKDHREYIAKKTWLMARWRDISLLRVQVA